MDDKKIAKLIRKNAAKAELAVSAPRRTTTRMRGANSRERP